MSTLEAARIIQEPVFGPYSSRRFGKSQIRDELRSAATVFGPGELDSITIASNGEPTLAPELDAVIDVVNESRDREVAESLRPPVLS